jgi:hypothetical protein
MGPNDASCVVWAIGTSFFKFSRSFYSNDCFIVYTCSLLRHMRRGGFGWAETTGTSPNDAKRVVWAISMFLFSFFRTNQYYLGSICGQTPRRGFGGA